MTNLQSTLVNLQNFNSTLQQQVELQQRFRAQGAFLRGDSNNQIGYVREGYNISSAVYSIVKDIAKTASDIPLKVYEVKSDTALKNYELSKRTIKTPEDSYRTANLRRKALTEVPEDNALQMLIDKPNPDDDTNYFYETTIGFRLLTGNWYWYAPVMDIGANKGKITELRIMPSPFVLLYVTNYFPSRVIGYELIINGVSLLETTNVIHSKYPNYDYTYDGQQLYGMSPLKAAARTLTRSNNSETTGISYLNNGGPSVIIANRSISSDDFGVEQIGKSKNQFNQEYAGPTNANKVKLMAGDISAIPLGITPVEMALIEGEQWNFDMLCNVYGISSTLFNSKAASTESNVKAMIKNAYTRAYIPERQAQADAFNRKIVPGYNTGGKRYFIDLDLSGINELQPDMAALSTWLGTSWWVTPNEKRELQDFGLDPDDNMNKIWMPMGLQTIDDATIQVDNIPEPDDSGFGLLDNDDK